MLLNKTTNPLEACELKFDDGNEGVFEGYASVWGRVDAVGDTVVKGAFENTLARYKELGRMPLMLFGHSPGRVIGKWRFMQEDDRGLRVVGELTPNHSDAENVKASLLHGAISGLSIGFRLPPGGSEESDGGRILKDIDLLEISVVTFPAETEARIDSVKSEIEAIETIRDMEHWLRDVALFSKSEAQCFVATAKRLSQREAEIEAERKLKAIQEAKLAAESGEFIRNRINQLLRG